MIIKIFDNFLCSKYISFETPLKILFAPNKNFLASKLLIKAGNKPTLEKIEYLPYIFFMI